MSSARQVYLPEDILREARATDAEAFVVRVRNGVIELVPEQVAERALDAGLENLRRASLDRLTEDWDNDEDAAWDEA